MVGRRLQLWHVVLLAMLPFVGWHLTGLTDIDEGFYGAISLEMLLRGDWIVPHLNGVPWFEKPVLVYWGAAASMAALGTEWGPRLFSVLSSATTIVAVFCFLRARFQQSVAEFSVWILTTTLLFVFVGRLLLADPPFVAFLTLAMLAWIQSLSHGPKWSWLSGIAIGLAVLAKGPVGLVTMVAVVGWTWQVEPDLRSQIKRSIAPVILGAMATASLWYVPALVREPELFLKEFIVKQNILRLFGGDVAHRVPPQVYVSYYFIVLMVLFAPWWWWAIKGWPKRSTVPDDQEHIKRILARWAIFILVLFTASGSKLPHYILPAVIPLAMLAAIRLGVRRPNLVGLVGHAITISALAVGVSLAYDRSSGQREAHDLAREARETGLPVANYQIRSRKRDLSITATPRETALPSLNVVYGKLPLELESLDVVYEGGKPVVLLTRKDRLGFVDRVEASKRNWRIERLKTKTIQSRFELYRISPMDSGPEKRR